MSKISTLKKGSALDFEGLYRVPADAKKRSHLLKHFDETFKNSSDFDFGELSPLAPNTLAGCVSWFLSPKNLPSPIIPEYLQDELIKAIGESRAKLIFLFFFYFSICTKNKNLNLAPEILI